MAPVGENSSIGWTEHSFNLWWGCTQVGGDPACDGCYAKARAENPYWWGAQTMFPIWGADAERRYFSGAHYEDPLRWNRRAEQAGKPARVFCMSMGDWAEGRPKQREFLEKHLFPLIPQTPWLIWLLLTKHPTAAAKIVPDSWQRHGWPKNAWPGVTAVTQQWWDIRVPQLMKIPAQQHFVSAEPLFERIDMRPQSPGVHPPRRPYMMACPRCNGTMSEPVAGGGKPCGLCFDSPAAQGWFDLPSWVIVGGKTGRQDDTTPMHPDHARALRDQCGEAGIPFFFKQWGTWHPLSRTDGVHELPFGQYLPETHGGYIPNKDAAFDKLLDGKSWEQAPEYQL
jgi:protein gp37